MKKIYLNKIQTSNMKIHILFCLLSVKKFAIESIKRI